ncbi:MAG: type II toxin-antitoxin system VapC family toxin [Treponema sp.]|nr:type II toxin-antitoxin system VapC family toxin [Treponema sp.]
MTQLLLDTNVFLWYFWGSDRIDSVKGLITSEKVEVFVSTVSFWEIVIKMRTGKLNIDLAELQSFARDRAFVELPITDEYMKAYRELPSLHRDPFDHMLLAQAITCPMRLITGDAILAEYSSLVMVV